LSFSACRLRSREVCILKPYVSFPNSTSAALNRFSSPDPPASLALRSFSPPFQENSSVFPLFSSCRSAGLPGAPFPVMRFFFFPFPLLVDFSFSSLLKALRAVASVGILTKTFRGGSSFRRAFPRPIFLFSDLRRVFGIDYVIAFLDPKKQECALSFAPTDRPANISLLLRTGVWNLGPIPFFRCRRAVSSALWCCPPGVAGESPHSVPLRVPPSLEALETPWLSPTSRRAIHLDLRSPFARGLALN